MLRYTGWSMVLSDVSTARIFFGHQEFHFFAISGKIFSANLYFHFRLHFFDFFSLITGRNYELYPLTYGLKSKYHDVWVCKRGCNDIFSLLIVTNIQTKLARKIWRRSWVPFTYFLNFLKLWDYNFCLFSIHERLVVLQVISCFISWPRSLGNGSSFPQGFP